MDSRFGGLCSSDCDRRRCRRIDRDERSCASGADPNTVIGSPLSAWLMNAGTRARRRRSLRGPYGTGEDGAQSSCPAVVRGRPCHGSAKRSPIVHPRGPTGSHCPRVLRCGCTSGSAVPLEVDASRYPAPAPRPPKRCASRESRLSASGWEAADSRWTGGRRSEDEIHFVGRNSSWCLVCTNRKSGFSRSARYCPVPVTSCPWP